MADLLFAFLTHSQSPSANEPCKKLLHRPHRNQGQDSGTQRNPNLLMLKALASSETIHTVNWDCLVNTRLLYGHQLHTRPVTIILQGVNMGVVLQKLDKQRESKELEQLLSPDNVTDMLNHFRMVPLLAVQVFILD